MYGPAGALSTRQANPTSSVPATPSRPWASGNFQQQKLEGRAGLEGAAIVNEVRTLAKVGEKQQARAWLGSLRVGL